MKTFPSILRRLTFLSLCWTGFAARAANPLPEFDFTRPDIVRQWHAQHHITRLQPTAEGLAIDIDGNDPYFAGPARDYPTDAPLWLVVRLKAPRAGNAQVFFFAPGTGPTEERSARFSVRGGDWEEARVPLPPIGPRAHLRIDPPGDRGTVLLASVRFERRVTLPAPQWPAWVAPAARPETVVVAGEVELRPGAGNAGSFEVRVAGQNMAFAHPRPRLAYVMNDEVRWMDLPMPATTSQTGGAWQIRGRATDPDGATWEIEQRFAADSPGAIRVETSVSVDRDRTVAFLPAHLIFAGEQSFGRKKGQGLFAGVEYLGDEPSSSEADLEGPEARRQIPAPHKITFPLMTIQAAGRYVGLIWEPQASVSAVFDSPDRLFGSGGHALGLIFPGASARQRAESDLMPYGGELLAAGRKLTSRAWIIGGRGDTVIPAVQQYVRLRGLPAQPDTGLAFQDYVTIAAHGWLDSKCREGDLYRHAFWPGFNPTPAADAALFELWLAAQTTNAPLAAQLRQAAGEAMAAVKPEAVWHAAVGHVRTPAPVLVFGPVEPGIAAARQQARQLLGRFAPDETIPYRRSPNHPDYGRTHFAPDANGLTAQVVASLLEAAAFTGDTNLIAQAVDKLRALDKFRGSVPRGAQTWEIPLHTPDILASAHLVDAYTLGYALTGEQRFLREAVYWAWTGVPFVYLVNPTGLKVGPYSTIAVLGATGWKAPVWIGLPVQWCGLVYADALYRLARYDDSYSWSRLADGITVAGLQHSWGLDDAERVGLLPDSYELLPQQRSGPAINPATVGVNATRLFGRGAIYDCYVFPETHVWVQAPASILPGKRSVTGISFATDGWPGGKYSVLVGGFKRVPSLRINGARAPLETPHSFEPASGNLILRLEGPARVEIDLQAGR